MRYVAAYMLAAMSGKHHVTTADIENILGSVGVDCDHDKASKVVDCMHGKSVDELITQGSQYLCSVGGAGGATAAPVAAGAPTGGAPAAGAAEPEKKEEKKAEKEEESDEDMGFGLFD